MHAIHPRIRRPGAIVSLGLLAALWAGHAHAQLTPNGPLVTDSASGMTWQRCALGQAWSGTTCSGSATVYTSWQSAIATAATANAANQDGHSDWRVPSLLELATLIVPGPAPTINATAFPGAPATTFWTASWPPNVPFPTAIDFNTGQPTLGLFGMGNFNVRLVRGGSAADQVTITAGVAVASAGRGSVSPALQRVSNQGGTGYVSVTPQPGYRWVTTAIGGTCAGASSEVTANAGNTAVLVREPTGNCTVGVAFEQIPGVWLIDVTAPTHGQISCPATVDDGQPLNCTATPDPGYQLVGWGDACAPAGTDAACTVNNVTSNVTVSAQFAAEPPVAVPTLGQWGLMLTGLLAAALGALGLRRRTKA